MARCKACAASSTRISSTSGRKRSAISRRWPIRRPRRWAPPATSRISLIARRILKVLKAHAIGHFFYIGGNNSSDTVRIVADEARKSGYPLRCNPHPQDDRQRSGRQRPHARLSLGGAVRDGQAFMGANLDNAALKGVYCAVVMGRHAGFLTAASALARKFPDDGPHLVYLPERTLRSTPFSSPT